MTSGISELSPKGSTGITARPSLLSYLQSAGGSEPLARSVAERHNPPVTGHGGPVSIAVISRQASYRSLSATLAEIDQRKECGVA